MPKDHGTPEFNPSRQRLFRKLKSVFGFATWKLLLIASACTFSYFTYKPEYKAIYWLTQIERFCQCATIACSNCVKTLTGYVADRNTLMRELKDARECIIEHEKALFDYERLKFENAYMRALLPIVNEQNLDTLTVVPQINPRTPLLVLLYTSLHVYDKIKVGNVVIAPQGAIGRVISKQKKRNFGEVSVLLATHIQSRLPVISKESRHKAILNGQNSPLMAIKHVQPDNDDAASKDAESKPFIGGGASLFKEGETLMLLCNGAELPVAKVVMRDGVAKAQWLIDSHVNYITVVISANVLAD